MRGFGAPRADETVELSVDIVKRLPWPTLTDAMWDRLEAAGKSVESLVHVTRVRKPAPRTSAPSPMASLGTTNAASTKYSAVRDARRVVDDLTFELLEVSARLRTAVSDETL